MEVLCLCHTASIKGLFIQFTSLIEATGDIVKVYVDIKLCVCVVESDILLRLQRCGKQTLALMQRRMKHQQDVWTSVIWVFSHHFPNPPFTSEVRWLYQTDAYYRYKTRMR